MGTLITSGQYNVTGYIETGSNTVSDGLFLKTAGLADIPIGRNTLTTGLQANLGSNLRNGLTDYFFNVSRNFMIGNFRIDTRAFYLKKNVSKYLRETSKGFLLSFSTGQFSLSSGVNFKTFNIIKSDNWIYNSVQDNKLKEIWNLLYSISYSFKPLESRWNITISINDYDYFTISQETNPSLNLTASFHMNNSTELFVQSTFKSAGMLNTNINHFGTYIKTGMTWDFRKK